LSESATTSRVPVTGLAPAGLTGRLPWKGRETKEKTTHTGTLA
jgi:hypothetical protein